MTVLRPHLSRHGLYLRARVALVGNRGHLDRLVLRQGDFLDGEMEVLRLREVPLPRKRYGGLAGEPVVAVRHRVILVRIQVVLHIVEHHRKRWLRVPIIELPILVIPSNRF